MKRYSVARQRDAGHRHAQGDVIVVTDNHRALDVFDRVMGMEDRRLRHGWKPGEPVESRCSLRTKLVAPMLPVIDRRAANVHDESRQWSLPGRARGEPPSG